MIGSNFKKSLVVAVATAVVAAAVPSVSQARYTGMTAPSVVVTTPVVKSVSTTKVVHTAKSTKHKSTRKHKKSTGKKHKA